MCHLQYIQDRKRTTLFPIILRFVALGNTIHSDEYSIYATLNQEGFEHKTVKHKEEYVSADGTHTNSIENVWTHMKNHFKKMHGFQKENLPLHLDEYIYRWNRKNEGDMFDLFLQDLANFTRV